MSKPPEPPYPPDLPDEPLPVASPADLVDAIATGADWANERTLGLSARRAELRRCRLTGADLPEAVLCDITFEECRLDLTGLRHARLERVVFRDCRMSECDLYGSSLKDVLFERCELREATFSECNLQRVELRGCDLAGARGAEALRGARLTWNDVVENAAVFAAAVGIEIVD